MALRKTNPPFLNGVPEMLLLELLSRRPMYGYELVQAIKVATGGGLEFGEGCVYPILHRLETQGVLAAAREGGRTRACRLPSDSGRKEAAGRLGEYVAARRGFHQPRFARRRSWTRSVGWMNCGPSWLERNYPRSTWNGWCWSCQIISQVAWRIV